MMCSHARKALLEAEPGEMRGEGDTPLSHHVRECAACQRLAALLLREEAHLGEALLEELPPPNLEAVLDAALRGPRLGRGEASSPGRPGAAGAVTSRQPLRFPPALKRGMAFLPLAAAAATAAILLSREPTLPGDPYLPGPPTAVEAEAPPGRDLAVFRTADPDITVVWLF